MFANKRSALHGELHGAFGSSDIRGQVLILLAALALLMAPAFSQPLEDSPDHASRIRSLVEEGRLEQAFQTTEDWIEAYPGDLDARAWHARLLAWTRRWHEAEREYRELIELSPGDVDLLAGLADLLIWQEKYAESLTFLDKAVELAPERTDCRIRRGQVMQRMGRADEAERIYGEILETDPGNAEARKGLDHALSAKRHELRFSSDLDSFSYTDNGASFELSLQSGWNARWNTFGSLHRYHRFGEGATLFEAGAAYKFSPRDTFTISAGAAGENGIIPRAKTEFEYSRGFSLSEDGPVRGLETLYRQRWLWYRDARLLVLSPAVILYLPGDWNCLFQYSSSRIATGGGANWESSGYTRLSFPVKSRAAGYILFAKGTENFNFADQIGRVSMLTWGGGVKFRLDHRHEIQGYGKYQDISDGRHLVSAGVVYALHF